MSKAKSVGWVIGHGQDCQEIELVEGQEDLAVGTDLFTKKAIAEAVAAEREGSAKKCDDLVTIMNALVESEDDPAFYEGASMALSMFAKAARSNFSADTFKSIRSAAK